MNASYPIRSSCIFGRLGFPKHLQISYWCSMWSIPPLSDFTQKHRFPTSISTTNCFSSLQGPSKPLRSAKLCRILCCSSKTYGWSTWMVNQLSAASMLWGDSRLRHFWYYWWMKPENSVSEFYCARTNQKLLYLNFIMLGTAQKTLCRNIIIFLSPMTNGSCLMAQGSD